MAAGTSTIMNYLASGLHSSNCFGKLLLPLLVRFLDLDGVIGYESNPESWYLFF